MLERIREGSQGVWAMIILGLVILSFVFAGVGSYISSSVGLAAASVNGEEIPKTAFEKAFDNERTRMESQYGEAFATLASDTAYMQQFRQSVLDRLIGEKLLDQAANDLGLRVSDKQIKQAIVGMQEFQVDGKFDNDRYIALLRQAGFQPNEFRDYMRVDMTRRQLSAALLGSEFSLTGEVDRAYQLQEQTRDLRYLSVPAKAFEQEVSVSEEQVNTYYQANISQFDTQQKVALQYVELTLADLLPNVTASEAEQQEYYQQSMNDYRIEEERRVSHILLDSVKEDSGIAAQAEEIRAKALAGEDFAELAKTLSNDAFSAENGGDLDFISRGLMDPAFEEATYALAKVGDISAVVKSDFGYHIIKLTDLKPEQVTPFAEVQADIELKVKTRKAEEEFYALQTRMAEVAFEVPDSLDELADIAGKTVQSSALFSRNQAPQALANPKVVNAAFSSELIEQGVNSEVIELGDNHIMVVRVAEHEAERTKAIEEVSADIKQTLLADAMQEAAREWANKLVSSLQSAEELALTLGETTLEWQSKEAVARRGGEVEQSIVESAFKLDLGSDKDSAVVDMYNGDIAVVQLIKINPAPPAEPQTLIALQGRLASMSAQNAYSDLIASLREKADISVYP